MSSTTDFEFARRIPQTASIGSTTITTEDHVHLSFGFAAGDLFPIAELGQAASQAVVLHGSKALQYSGANGATRINKWIQARSHVHGIQAEADQIVVTYGAIQGIQLTLSALINPGDHIWVEAPSFFGSLQCFRIAEAELTSFPIDENGVKVDLIEAALIEAKLNNKPLPKILYTMPMYHNPGGVTLSLERRQHLARLAKEYNFFILEDDAYMELNFTGNYLPSIYSLCPERVIYVNTFSKIIGPGIRLGWLIANKEVVNRIIPLLVGTSIAPFTQQILAELLDSFSFHDHINRLRERYRHNRDAAAIAIQQCWGDDVTFTLPEGGFFIWLKFREDVNTSVFLRDAAERGVSFVDGKSFYLDEDHYNEARICFSYCNEEQIKRGIRLMADAYYAYYNTRS